MGTGRGDRQPSPQREPRGGGGSQAGDGGSLLDPAETEKLVAAAQSDVDALRAEFLFAPPVRLHKPLAALLEDSRDLPILFLYLNVLLTTVPAAVALFCFFPTATRPLPHWLGAAYLVANCVAYLGRFMLSLHYSQHRRLFRRGESVGSPAPPPPPGCAAAQCDWQPLLPLLRG